MMRICRKAIRLPIVIIFCVLFNGTHAQQDEFTAHAKAFLATPEGGGEQNALSNYVRAMEHFDTQMYLRHKKAFDQILKNGCTGRETNEMNTLRSLQPILNEIWRGNEKEFVRYPPYESSSSPIPDFLTSQLLGKLMVIQALYCEYINRPAYAMGWYKHALIFGQRACDVNSTVIAKLISVYIEEIVLKAFQESLIRQNLTTGMYLKIADDLTRLRSSDTPFWRVLRNQHRVMYNMIKTINADPNEMKRLPIKEQHIKYIISNREAVLKEYKEFTQRLESLLQKDLAVIVRTDFQAFTASLSPFLKTFVSNFLEAPIREGRSHARWSLAIATAQIRAYRAEKGTLSPNLSALSEIGVTPPKDPFSNHMLKYIFRVNSAILYSIGPGLMDNGGRLDYDPKNGTVSSGDIAVNVR